MKEVENPLLSLHSRTSHKRHTMFISADEEVMEAIWHRSDDHGIPFECVLGDNILLLYKKNMSVELLFAPQGAPGPYSDLTSLSTYITMQISFGKMTVIAGRWRPPFALSKTSHRYYTPPLFYDPWIKGFQKGRFAGNVLFIKYIILQLLFWLVHQVRKVALNIWCWPFGCFKYLFLDL